MKINKKLVFNIEHLKFNVHKLDEFKDFCKFREKRFFGGIHLFKLFSKQNEFGGFHDKAIYEFHRNPRGVNSLYSHLCNIFEEYNFILEAIAKGEITHFARSYFSLINTTTEGDYIYKTYQDYIDSGRFSMGELAREFLKDSAIGPLMAKDFYQKLPDELNSLNGSTILTETGYSQFYNDIAFVDKVNSFDIFRPNGESRATVNVANIEHERLRMKLRSASIYQAIYYYWLFIASKAEGKDKEINLLKAQVNSEKVNTFLMAANVDLNHINNQLSKYYVSSPKAKKNNHRQNVKKDNYHFVEVVMDEITTNNFDKSSESFNKSMSGFVSSKRVMSKVNDKIVDHNNDYGEEVKIIKVDKTIIKHIKTYFKDKDKDKG